MKKYRVISKRYNKQCDVEATCPRDAQLMAESWGKEFALTRSNPLTIQEIP